MTLEEGVAEAAFTDVDAGFAVEAGDDEGDGWGSLEVTIMRKQRFKGNKACFALPWDEIYKNIHEVVEASKSQKDHFERNLAALYEMREQMAETDRRMKETDRKMAETDRMIKATSEQMKETDRKIA